LFMARIAAVGDLNEDLLMEVDHLPAPDSQVVARSSISAGGGSAANFAVACATMGEDAALYAAVGDDTRGCWLRGLAAERGVDVGGVQVMAGASTGITVAQAHDGLRTMTSHRGTNALYEGRGFDARIVEADWVHLTSYFLLSKLRNRMTGIARTLARRGIKVSFDPGWHHGRLTALDVGEFDSIFSSLEFFCPNLQEARAYLTEPDAGAKRLARLGVEKGVKVCCITLGEDGCVACEGDDVVSVPAVQAPARDSCGAGDTFAAGFAVARLSNKNLVDCARYANAAAAVSLRGPGWGHYPTAEEVERALSGEA